MTSGSITLSQFIISNLYLQSKIHEKSQTDISYLTRFVGRSRSGRTRELGVRQADLLRDWPTFTCRGLFRFVMLCFYPPPVSLACLRRYFSSLCARVLPFPLVFLLLTAGLGGPRRSLSFGKSAAAIRKGGECWSWASRGFKHVWRGDVCCRRPDEINGYSASTWIPWFRLCKIAGVMRRGKI